ncbi:hypothetical protein IQ274_27810 [Nostoc sp. LEGE 12447]|uniref:DUF6734 family protein n=1 Tax=Nostoc sp. LEGE 12447 TaxID=1828640 RepID=UPI001683B759|nr:DUF6734 family protein [Nostoc sp. LEGE 12447]MBD2511504.1 hypothetical protein [Desmonostoc muscorum FACHB-395]MBE9001904.1 hypothetical protein [Nostoc sp. LEGE 12447]
MKAVWSFWTKPLQANQRRIWLSEKYHLLAWILSLETAKKHFEKTALFTDTQGARQLVDELGLEFDEVYLELDALQDHDPKWWALGKVYTYRAQTEPFIHIDNDVFLWQNLPAEIISAPLLAQNPEYFLVGNSWYDPEGIEAAIHSVNGWLPDEWQWQRSRGSLQVAYNCGIFGGNAVDFISYYADLAIKFVEHPANQRAWNLLTHSTERNVLFEQYILGCCLEYCRYYPHTPYQNIDIKYLFPSLDEAFVPENATRLGFTHLIADAKRNPTISASLEKRVQRDYPEHYSIIQRL